MYSQDYKFYMVNGSNEILCRMKLKINIQNIETRLSDKLTVNSVTWIELAIGSNNPASLYIASIKATQEVDLPSL